MKAFFSVLISTLIILTVAGGLLVLDIFKRKDLILPRTLVGDLNLSGMTRAQARTVLAKRISEFTTQPIRIAARGEAKTATLNELGIVLNESLVVASLPFASRFSNAEIILHTIAGHREVPNVKVEKTQILRVINEKFPNIPKATNAYFKREGKDIKIVEATSGVSPILDPFVEKLSSDISFFENNPLIVEFNEAPPTIFAADLKKYEEPLKQAIKTSLKLVSGTEQWTVDFDKHPDWILFERTAHGELPFIIQWDPLAFSNFINGSVAKKLEQAPDDVLISRAEKGQIIFSGKGNEGKAIEYEQLLSLANGALKDKFAQVEIPLKVVPPRIEVAEDLQALGIKDLLAVGHTSFTGSPANRKHNIGVGVARFNGDLIAPEEVFSFDQNLGRVDETTGYRKELVIKPEGTIPEFGGGLCQVSSTFYRGAVFAGLPIVDRTPHSYAVSYYAQIGGHGLDATIYPPSRDLKFKNDTPGHILVQSYVEGDHAFFKLYGTSDGRKVEMDGPYISNRKAAPSAEIIVPDKKLKPGERKQVEKAHGGFDVVWYRNLTNANGETVKEKIFSKYKATAAKFLVGSAVESVPADTAGEAVNPFE